MSVPAHHIQGSEPWLQWRATRGMASELAAILGCSPFMPRNAFELWQVKTGRKQVFVTPAMRRGSQFEDAARRYYETVADEVFEPQVMERDRIGASLDGLTMDGARGFECKIPAKGRESEVWQAVERNQRPPDYYWWQVQQQLYVSRAKAIDFVVGIEADGEITDHIACTVEPDGLAHQTLVQAWQDFFPHLDCDEPPPAPEPEIAERDDTVWLSAVDTWNAARAALVGAQDTEKAARERLIELSAGVTTQGGGIRVIRAERTGSVDYKAIPELRAVDLEKYRKPATEMWTIKAVKS